MGIPRAKRVAEGEESLTCVFVLGGFPVLGRKLAVFRFRRRERSDRRSRIGKRPLLARRVSDLRSSLTTSLPKGLHLEGLEPPRFRSGT